MSFRPLSGYIKLISVTVEGRLQTRTYGFRPLSRWIGLYLDEIIANAMMFDGFPSHLEIHRFISDAQTRVITTTFKFSSPREVNRVISMKSMRFKQIEVCFRPLPR